MDKQELREKAKLTDSVLKSVLSNCVPSKALYVDLTTQSNVSYEIPQAYLEKYGTGRALGARLWADFAGYSMDDPSCMEEENPIVIVPSVTVQNSIPFSGLTTVVFRSPVTRVLAFNTFRSCISFGAFSAVIINGRLKDTGVISYLENVFDFGFDRGLKDLTVSQIAAIYKNAIISGPSSEKRVVFSSAVFNSKFIGRGGLGYVMGCKNLKAVVCLVNKTEDNHPYKTLKKRLLKSKIKTNLDGYRLACAGTFGWAPIKNFSDRTDPRLFFISNPEFERKIEQCKHPCPYDARLMLGPNCGTFDIEKIQSRYETCLEYSLDPVSVGNILGYIYQAQNDGIIIKAIDLQNNKSVNDFITSIAKSSWQGQYYTNGIVCAANKFGGKNFAYQINGLECGPYDYRGNFTQALSDALGNCQNMHFNPVNNFALWTSFDEELSLGLESLGIDSDILFLIQDGLSIVRKFLSKFSVFPAGLFVKVKEITDVLKEVLKTDLSKKNLRTLGGNCRTLVRNINSFLYKTKPDIPQHFCEDPQSNYHDQVVVSFHQLVDEYFSQNYSFK